MRDTGGIGTPPVLLQSSGGADVSRKLLSVGIVVFFSMLAACGQVEQVKIDISGVWEGSISISSIVLCSGPVWYTGYTGSTPAESGAYADSSC